MQIQRAVVLVAVATALIAATRVPGLAGGDSPSSAATVEVRTGYAGVAVNADGRLTLPQLVSVLRAAGWPERELANAVDVAACESQWNPKAVGDSGERGLFQIHPVHDHRFDLMGVVRDAEDPVHNASVALAIWRKYGWAPWTCQPD